MPQVTEINSIEQLASYRMQWAALLGDTRDASFFQSLDWLETYWAHFGADQRLRVLIVGSDDEVLGILPLVVRTEATRMGPIRFLTYPLQDWGTFFGPIGPNPTATLLIGMRHIANTKRDWDLLDMRWVNADGYDAGRTKNAMLRAGFRPNKQVWTRAASVEIDCSWDAFWSSRPQRWRSNLQRSQRRLEEHASVTYVRYRPEGSRYGDSDPRWDLYDACLQVAEKSWQAESSSGNTLCTTETRDFLRDAHAAAAKAGTLDLNLMLVDGKPAAYAYNYHCNARVSGLRKGFDPALARFSPGSLLEWKMFEDGFRRGDRHYDLGVGAMDSKRHWQTSTVNSYRYTHFPNNDVRTQVLRMKRWYQDRFVDTDTLADARSA